MKPLFSVSAKIRDSLLIAGSTAALTCWLGGAAFAGNLEEPVVEAPIFTPAPAEPAPSWAGFYLGGSIGYDFQGDDEVGHRNTAGTIVASPDTLKQHGFNYGLHAGWRGERALSDRTAVYGLEFGYMGGKADDDFTTDGYTASTDLNYVLGLRGKAGVTNRSGDTLFYGILGFVRGDFDYSVTGTTGGDSIALDTSYKSNGFAAGVGVERKLSENWSVRAEYEYLQFQKKDLTDAGGASTKATPKFHNVQLGVNFRF